MIYIIIPVLNRRELTRNCLMSLTKQLYQDYKIIVVNHGSTDGTDRMIDEEFKNVILINTDDSKWWTGAINIGINKAIELSNDPTDRILTLNDDLEVEENYLTELVTISDMTKPSIVGSVSVNIFNSNQVIFCGTKWDPIFAKYTKIGFNSKYNIIASDSDYLDSDLLPGRGTLYPIKIFIIYGLFDEKNFPHYAADEDFSRFVSTKGYKLIVSTKAIVRSYYMESGLKQNKTDIIKFFSSFKSPSNIKTRWNWAFKNSPFPLFYFMCDFSRNFGSYLKYKFK